MVSFDFSTSRVALYVFFVKPTRNCCMSCKDAFLVDWCRQKPFGILSFKTPVQFLSIADVPMQNVHRVPVDREQITYHFVQKSSNHIFI